MKTKPKRNKKAPPVPIYTRIVMRCGAQFDPVFASDERYQSFLANLLKNRQDKVELMQLQVGRIIDPKAVEVIMILPAPKKEE